VVGFILNQARRVDDRKSLGHRPIIRQFPVRMSLPIIGDTWPLTPWLF
jgi:hypothetical protein